MRGRDLIPRDDPDRNKDNIKTSAEHQQPGEKHALSQEHPPIGWLATGTMDVQSNVTPILGHMGARLHRTLAHPLMYNHAVSVLDELKLPQGLVIRLVHGDITQSQAEAIVNAANAQLHHGGGVAAAIAHAGGPTIQSESDDWRRENGPITHDSPALTSAGDMPCRHVIHAVGPVWGEGDEVRKLSTTIQSALGMADAHAIKSLALPAISTGIFGFPKQLGAQVILDALEDYAEQHPDTSLEWVAITLIDEPSVRIFKEAFDKRLRSET